MKAAKDWMELYDAKVSDAEKAASTAADDLKAS